MTEKWRAFTLLPRMKPYWCYGWSWYKVWMYSRLTHCFVFCRRGTQQLQQATNQLLSELWCQSLLRTKLEFREPVNKLKTRENMSLLRKQKFALPCSFESVLQLAGWSWVSNYQNSIIETTLSRIHKQNRICYHVANIESSSSYLIVITGENSWAFQECSCTIRQCFPFWIHCLCA